MKRNEKVVLISILYFGRERERERLVGGYVWELGG